jgi:hypothetical protein
MARLRARYSFAISLWLAACGTAPESSEPIFRVKEGPNPLETCETRNFGRFTRGVRCKDLHVLLVSRDAPPAALHEGLRINLDARGFAPRVGTLRVNGRDLPALEYSMGTAARPVLHEHIVPLAVPGSSEPIEAHCYSFGGSVDTARCQSVLDGFIAQGLFRGEWPRVLAASAPRESLMLDVVGRQARLPSTCTELAPLDLECEDGHVRMLVPDDAQKLARLLEADLYITRSEPLIGERTVPCALEGVSTTCTLRRSRLPYGDELLSYHATAVVRGQPLLLACDAKKSRANPEPGPICGQFFRFEGDALVEPQAPVE